MSCSPSSIPMCCWKLGTVNESYADLGLENWGLGLEDYGQPKMGPESVLSRVTLLLFQISGRIGDVPDTGKVGPECAQDPNETGPHASIYRQIRLTRVSRITRDKEKAPSRQRKQESYLKYGI